MIHPLKLEVTFKWQSLIELSMAYFQMTKLDRAQYGLLVNDKVSTQDSLSQL